MAAYGHHSHRLSCDLSGASQLMHLLQLLHLLQKLLILAAYCIDSS